MSSKTSMTSRRIISPHDTVVVSTLGLSSMQESYRCHIFMFRNFLWVLSCWFGTSLIFVLNCDFKLHFFCDWNKRNIWCKAYRRVFSCLLNMPKPWRVSEIQMMASRKNCQLFYSCGTGSSVDVEALCSGSVQEPLLWASFKRLLATSRWFFVIGFQRCWNNLLCPVLLLTTSCPWASSVPWLPRRPMGSWGALGGVWPAGRGRFSFPFTLP